MRQVVDQLIDDFLERPIPIPVPREARAPLLPGKATTVVGMRRAGKTWFCYQRMHELLDAGLPKQRMLYLNFEDERLLPFAASDFQTILDSYYAKFPDHKDQQCHLFLDEVQRVEGWPLFVRRVLDTEKLTVWVTGSSSKLLSREIATSLRGRTMNTEIFPFSFAEFLRFHGVTVGLDGSYGSQTRAHLQNMADRYLREGGFPETQSIEDAETRRQVFRTYLDVALFRDVVERHAVSNVVALRSLLQHIIAAPATRFSLNKFYNDLRSRGVKCAKNSLYDFLDYLTDAYLVYPVAIHSRSEKARQVNPKKIYVIDTGLLTAMSVRMTEDRGALLENLVFMHLRRQGLVPTYYVSDNGLGVDFILKGNAGHEDALIQVCWSLEREETREREVRGLRMAMDETGIRNGIIITWVEERLVDGVAVVPVWRWLVENGRAK